MKINLNQKTLHTKMEYKTNNCIKSKMIKHKQINLMMGIVNYKEVTEGLNRLGMMSKIQDLSS